MPESWAHRRRARACRGAAVLAFGAVAACAPWPRPAPADPVARFADAYVRLLPMGELMGQAAAQDPSWPLGDTARRVSVAQLACIRSALAPAELVSAQRSRARDYALAHADTLADDLAVLEAGAARLIGDAMQGGAGAASLVTTPATPDEMQALAAFVSQPRYEALRRATGLERLVGATGASPAQRGQDIGRALTVQFMTDAFLRCHIPVKLLY